MGFEGLRIKFCYIITLSLIEFTAYDSDTRNIKILLGTAEIKHIGIVCKYDACVVAAEGKRVRHRIFYLLVSRLVRYEIDTARFFLKNIEIFIRITCRGREFAFCKCLYREHRLNGPGGTQTVSRHGLC